MNQHYFGNWAPPRTAAEADGHERAVPEIEFEAQVPAERRHVEDRREGERRGSHRWSNYTDNRQRPGNDSLGAGKQSNPKDVIGSRKLPFSVLPWRVLVGVALAMLEGALKYGRHNYRAAGVRASVYFDACVGRHMTAWWEGEDIDPDSGRHHIDKAIAGLMVMRDSMLHGNFEDDRPPRGGVDMEEANREAGRLMDLHADKKPHHFTIKDAP